MGKFNFGIIKNGFFNTIKESIFNDNLLLENKGKINEFVTVIKSSPILRLENDIFSNLENKHITNESMAIKYIDDNISLIKKYSADDIIYENKKLSKFSKNSKINEDKEKLYNAINDLIIESCNTTSIPDIDLIHESFNVILNHIITNEKELIDESIIKEDIISNFEPETLISIALNKFNNKFSSLDENERKLLYVLAVGGENERKNVFESLKRENIEILNSINNDALKETVIKTKNKINSMQSDPISIQKNTIELYKLKKELT